jgi:hypothetical protein
LQHFGAADESSGHRAKRLQLGAASVVDLTDVCRCGSLHLDLRLDPPHLFTVCAMSMTCSSHDMSCPSPVVPPMMSPCTPLSICRQQDHTGQLK